MQTLDDKSAGSPGDRVSADVVVIGAGIIGCAIALNLAQSGADVSVVERSSVVGREASGTNAGTVSPQVNKQSTWPSKAFPVDLAVESLALWASIEEQLGAAIDYRRTGGFRVARTKEELSVLRTVAEHERKHGLQVEILSGDEARQVEPALSDLVVGASYCKAGGRANPYLTTRAFAAAAVQAGARFRFNCQITHVMTENRSRLTLHSSKGTRISCQTAIIAAGVGTLGLAEDLGVRAPFKIKINQACVTEKLPPFMSHVVTQFGRALSLRQLHPGNILIGGGWDGIQSAPPLRHLVRYDSLVNNVADARAVLRHLGDVRIIRAWAAADLRLEDQLPLLDRLPADPRVMIAVGDKVGFTLAPLVGKLISELVLTGKTYVPIHRFGLERFRAAGT